MRLTQMMSVVLGALMVFGACNKENDGVRLSTERSAAQVSIHFDTGKFRAYGQDGPEAVKSLEVFIFNGEYLDGYGRAEMSGASALLEVKGIDCSAGDRTVIAVANANVGKSIGSLTALKDFIVTLNVAMQSAQGLVMSSESVVISVKAGKNGYGYPATAGYANLISEDKPMPLVRLNAKIEIVELIQAFTGVYEGMTFEADRLYLLNANSQSKLINASTDMVYFEGLESTEANIFGSAFRAPNSIFNSMFAQVYESGTGGFYTMPNNGTQLQRLHPAIFVVGGVLKKDGEIVSNMTGHTNAEGYTYYPVRVNFKRENDTNYSFEGQTAQNEHNGEIVRNTQYKISLKVKRPGTDKPYDDVDVATLDVLCNVAPWVVYDQHVEY